MSKAKKKIMTAFVLLVCIAVVIIAGFYIFSKKSEEQSGQKTESGSEVEKLLEKDLDTKYPETPAEVVKLYWRYNKCMYNTKMSDEDFEGLLKQLRILYDEEFLAQEGNSWEDMLDNFKKDKKAYNDKSKIISIYTVEPNSSTVYGEDSEGRECATVICNTMLKEKSERTKVYEKFMCRRDDDGKWKILGWEQVDSSDVENDTAVE